MATGSTPMKHIEPYKLDQVVAYGLVNLAVTAQSTLTHCSTPNVFDHRLIIDKRVLSMITCTVVNSSVPESHP